MTIQVNEKVQGEFLASILQGSKAVDRNILRHVEPGFFSVDSYKWMAKVLKGRDWVPFAVDYLDQELLSVPDEQVRFQYKHQLTLLYNRELLFEEDANDTFKSYVTYCVIKSSVNESLEGYSRSGRVDLLIKQLQEGIISASDVMKEDRLKVVDYAERYNSRQFKRRSIRDNPVLSPRILTGIYGLDDQFIIKAPMIVDFMAPFKRYKSIVLNTMGYAFLLQGFNVVHVTYENTIDMTEDRYDSMFTEFNYDRVSNILLTQEEKDHMDRMFEWINSWENRLKIIECEANITTVKEVEEKIERMIDEEGFIPDVEIWDYLNIIAPSQKNREERLEQKRIVWDLKNHAKRFDVPIIEASQSNMEGADEGRLKMTSRGKSVDISQGIDLSIAIDQTKKEAAAGIIVLSPLFARNAKITIPQIVLDSDIEKMQLDRSLHELWTHAARINPYA